MLLWQNVPIAIVNRNRLGSLRRMIQWLIEIGCTNIQILDNESSFPPLLDYYANLPLNVRLCKLRENIGPWVFWELGLHKEVNTPYIVTDSDLVPAASCPVDLVAHMLDVATRFPDCGKVGPGLCVERISPNYTQGETAVKWESQFWSRPLCPGIFSAPVDTTFALYPAGSDFTRNDKNLRLGYPYLLEHTPWQVDDNNLDEEETHYRAHTSRRFSHWSAPAIDSRIGDSEFIKNYERRKRILHLGCGNEYIPGWINVDVSGRKLDIELDFINCTQKLPLGDDSVDGFYVSHVFGHIKDTFALMDELYRVANNGAKAHIRLPYGASNDAWDNPASARVYFESSFAQFSQPGSTRMGCGYLADWQTDRVTLVVEPSLLQQSAQAASRQIRTQRNVVLEMVVELSAVKPARPRLQRPLKDGEIVIVSDPRILPTFSL